MVYLLRDEHNSEQSRSALDTHKSLPNKTFWSSIYATEVGTCPLEVNKVANGERNGGGEKVASSNRERGDHLPIGDR